LDDESLQVETAGARKALESILGEPVYSAACPFGSYDRRVIEKLKEIGFREVFTSDGGETTPGKFPMSRTTIRNDDTPESIEKTLSIPYYHPKALVKRFKRRLKQWR
jgi:peptidoglycan/xylan/chitin deacetylase (PgdA/CDA1 family)